MVATYPVMVVITHHFTTALWLAASAQRQTEVIHVSGNAVMYMWTLNLHSRDRTVCHSISIWSLLSCKWYGILYWEVVVCINTDNQEPQLTVLTLHLHSFGAAPRAGGLCYKVPGVCPGISWFNWWRCVYSPIPSRLHCLSRSDSYQTGWRKV